MTVHGKPAIKSVIGFDIDNQPFEDNSRYFRNALARANYRNAAIGASADDSYLKHFFGDLLLGEHNDLRNRTVHIYWAKSEHSIGDPINDSINPVENMVLEHLRTRPHATYDEISSALGKSTATIRRAIQALKAKGLIARVGSNKTGQWKILAE